MSYSQLAEGQRYQIAVLLEMGKSVRRTAQLIGVHPSTVSRELRRNGHGRNYCPLQAQARSEQRRREAPKARRMTPALVADIEALLREEWSPEQIAGWLRVTWGFRISHERIYQHVWEDRANGGDLYRYLRRGGKRYRRHWGKGSASRIPHRVGIEARPAVVAQRSRLGDWEGDTLLGGRRGAAVVTLVERKSRYTLLGKVGRRFADHVRDAILGLLRPHRGKRHTLTLDNGSEFVEHERLSKALGLGVFFAGPYRAWERGTNENTNGLLRQYLPKGMDFEGVSEAALAWIMDRLNHRPRKCLGFRTPHEVFYAEIAGAAR
jgi:IS30 family transposase